MYNFCITFLKAGRLSISTCFLMYPETSHIGHGEIQNGRSVWTGEELIRHRRDREDYRSDKPPRQSLNTASVLPTPFSHLPVCTSRKVVICKPGKNPSQKLATLVTSSGAQSQHTVRNVCHSNNCFVTVVNQTKISSIPRKHREHRIHIFRHL